MPIENESGNDKGDPKGKRPDESEVNPVNQQAHPSDTNQNSDGRKSLTRYEWWQVALTIIGAFLAAAGLFILHQQSELMSRQTKIMDQ